MRHEQVKAHDSYEKVDVAAVWPCTTQLAPLPIPDISESPKHAEAAAPDVPAAVGGLIAASYAALIAAFAIGMAGSGKSIFMITVCALFVVVYLTIPRIFFGIEPETGKRPSLQRFLDEGMDTLTGHTGGGAALTQILIVPVLLTLGVLVMGIAAAYYL